MSKAIQVEDGIRMHLIAKDGKKAAADEDTLPYLRLGRRKDCKDI